MRNRINKVVTISLLTLSTLGLVACSEAEPEHKESIISQQEIASSIPSVGILVQKSDLPVKRLKLAKESAETGDYYYLVFSNYTDDERNEREINNKPAGDAFGFTLSAEALNSLIAVFQEPITDSLNLANAQARGYFYTKYSQTSQELPRGLYFKYYRSMLVVTSSYWQLAENQMYISVNEAPKLASMLVELQQKVDK